MDAFGPSTVYALSGTSATDVWAATEYDGLYQLGQTITKAGSHGQPGCKQLLDLVQRTRLRDLWDCGWQLVSSRP